MPLVNSSRAMTGKLPSPAALKLLGRVQLRGNRPPLPAVIRPGFADKYVGAYQRLVHELVLRITSRTATTSICNTDPSIPVRDHAGRQGRIWNVRPDRRDGRFHHRCEGRGERVGPSPARSKPSRPPDRCGPSQRHRGGTGPANLADVDDLDAKTLDARGLQLLAVLLTGRKERAFRPHRRRPAVGPVPRSGVWRRYGAGRQGGAFRIRDPTKLVSKGRRHRLVTRKRQGGQDAIWVMDANGRLGAHALKATGLSSQVDYPSCGILPTGRRLAAMDAGDLVIRRVDLRRRRGRNAHRPCQGS